MLARIVIALDGQMAVFVDEGTKEQAEELSRQLYQAIGQAVPIAALSEPEQHRHAKDENVHLHGHMEA